MDIMAWQNALYSVWVSTITSLLNLFPHILGAIVIATIGVVIANWVAHQIHREGVYESELERIGNLYFLRDEPPHRRARF